MTEYNAHLSEYDFAIKALAEINSVKTKEDTEKVDAILNVLSAYFDRMKYANDD